ncbi:hypothetical protein [Streptosporangium carneum]|uniref:Uncharacterized protein n=1 Tax=Streptosporangium carneum TaxID=47481 RepID=A0A9W6I381_9ACTN|nr:hypothetical protein [Streptosporangium carneum]GLK11221.1 hypothetical protein GCM10017600_46270 [Streptosporangium carneum]
MTDEEPAREEAASAAQEPISTRIRQLTEAIGPTTLATALLIYFGYVATRARFDYFGVSLEMTDLSNQSLLLYGLEVVYVPAALIFLGALTVIGVHTAVMWRLTRRPDDLANTFLAAGIGLVGVLMIGRALIGMFVEGSDTSVVIGATPLSLAFGPGTVAYGVWLHGKIRGRPLLSQRLARNGVICAVGLAVAGLFWASTQVAWAYGTGRGEEDAHDLAKRPEVVIDTKEPLAGLPSGVTQTALTTRGKDPAFVHRYHGFRLLLASGGRLFLVSGTWTLGRDQTIVLPYDNGIRIQLISQP